MTPTQYQSVTGMQFLILGSVTTESILALMCFTCAILCMIHVGVTRYLAWRGRFSADTKPNHFRVFIRDKLAEEYEIEADKNLEEAYAELGDSWEIDGKSYAITHTVICKKTRSIVCVVKPL
jgi:hypothetical protein